jgi:hypothetical protein
MATEEPQTNSVVRVPAEREIAGVQVIGQEALAELEDPVVPVAQAALAELAVRGDRVALAELAVRVVRVAPAELVAQAVERELGIAPVVAREQAIVPVEVLELEIVQAAVGLALVQVAAEPELVQAAVELGLVPVALLAKSRLVTAVRHPGQVPVPKRVEDLAAAAAETTRAPAATEAATAWAAAV